MSLNVKALILNRQGEKRLSQSGVILVSTQTNAVLFLAKSPLSLILKNDFSRHGEYGELNSQGRKIESFWYANNLDSFLKAAPGYYSKSDYVLLSQDLDFEPNPERASYMTEAMILVDSEAGSLETIFWVTN